MKYESLNKTRQN